MYFQNIKFKIVIIDYPIYILDDPSCATLFGKALKMKFDGYSVTYSENVLPMDKTDFFGTHLMLCEEIGQELIPIFAYKSVSLNRCLKYNFEFPILSIAKNDCHSTCLDDLQKILNQITDTSSISYDSALAKNLIYRFSNDVELKTVLREITMMMIVKHHQDYKIPHMINCGAVKVQTDKFFLKLGLKKLNEHAHFIQKHLNNEESVIFYNNSFSFEAYRMAKKYKQLWDNRLVIDGMDIRRKIARAV